MELCGNCVSLSGMGLAKLRAFTLIELLVVIAVIAILAAILFPVFAQAKVAAKGTASLSNIKQIGTSHFLYAADYDDFSVLVGRMDPAAPVSSMGRFFYSWAWLLQPYVKNSQVFQDPVTTPEQAFDGNSVEISRLYHTQFGYAYTIHSPWRGNFMADGAFPLSQTSLANPAETVHFVSKKARNGNGDWLAVGTPIWAAYLINPPFCVSTETGTNPGSRCVPGQRWGTGATTYLGQSFAEGAFTGGVAFRKAGKTAVVWSDGHASWKSPDQLAAGTNWRRDLLFASVRVTEPEKYLWDSD